MLYRIELRYFYGWDDAGWTSETDTETTPMRFRTVDDARAALDTFFAEVKAAVIAGTLDIEEARTDYRIVETSERVAR